MTSDLGLVLPSPARELWLRTRAIVDDGLRQVQGGSARYAIGGGTILAARWRHRTSFDIDITVSPDTPLHKADDPYQSDFNRRMTEAGGKPAYSPELNKYKIAFEGGSEIDLWATAPIFGTADKQERVEGHDQAVLSSAQILRGKLERAEMNMVRDVADVIAAAQHDPESLEAAINSIPRAMGEYIAWSWHHANPILREDARTALRGTDNREPNYHNLGSQGARAVQAALYDALEIGVSGRRIRLRVETAGGERRSHQVTPENADEHFEEHGLNAHLKNKGPGADELREYAKTQALQGRHDFVVYREANDAPTHWRTAKTGYNLPVEAPR